MDDMQALCERLARLPAAVVSDVLYAMGLHHQVVASSIRATEHGATMTGPALCLRGREGPEPATKPKPVYEMDRHLQPGMVAVIASGNHRIGAVVGGNIGAAFVHRGCRGVLTDGGIRDAAEFAEMGLTIFSTFITPLSNKGHWAMAEIDAPVTLPGQAGTDVSIATGDLIHADRDGVVVVPKAHAAQVIADAEIVERIEAQIKARIEAGEDREAVFAVHDRFAHIRKVAG